MNQALDELIQLWQLKAKMARNEADRIFLTIKSHTEAERRCLTRAEIWEYCVDTLSDCRNKHVLTCNMPPSGWYCTRVKGHDGPCAAVKCQKGLRVWSPSLWIDHKKRHWLIGHLFNRYQWFRRWYGGHWECWYNDLTHTDMWFQMSECTKPTGWRPPCCMGSPTCEYY